MTTIKIKKESNYSVISNVPINDKRLSWESRGILLYLLSKPNDWEIRTTDLERQGPAQNFKIRRVLKELRECGYLIREQINGEKGRLEWVSYIYEIPLSEEDKKSTIARLSTRGSSTCGKPRDILNTESLNTDIQNTELKEGPPIFSSTGDSPSNNGHDKPSQPSQLETMLLELKRRYDPAGQGKYDLPTGTKADIRRFVDQFLLEQGIDDAQASLKFASMLYDLISFESGNAEKIKSAGGVMQAVAAGADKMQEIKDKICKAFAINPKWDSKRWKYTLQFLAERPDNEALDVWIAWFKREDWRGKKGEPPEPEWITEFWPRAFMSPEQQIGQGFVGVIPPDFKPNEDGSYYV